MQRIEMNTKSLQKHFPDVYRDFFANNDLVVSGSFSFSWVPLLSSKHVSNFLRIKSKTPLKCYVWIKKRKDNNIIIKNVTIYDLIKKTFEIIPFSKINSEEEKIIDLLKEISNESWFDIEILSEISRGHSFWFSGTFWALASYWINKFINKLSFDEVFINWWKIDHISRFGNSNWGSTINTLKETNWIHYYLTEKFDSSINLEELKDVNYIFEKISDNTEIKIPLDYMMIFSWLPTDTKQVEYYKSIDKQICSKDQEYLKTKFSANFLKKTNYDNFTKDDVIFDNLSNNLSILNIRTLKFFDKVLNWWYTENWINKLIDNINEYRHAISIIESQSNFAENFIYYFNKNKVNSEESLWITPGYYSKFWWWYIVATKPGISRATIEKTLEDIKNIYPDAEIEYCSYLDGESSDGAMVEQFISEWVYSQYVDKNKFLFKSNKWDNYIWDYNEIIEKEKDWLLFDMINNKIYLNWEKLTSKDIPSQNTTIEVITRLLEHIWEEISNKELPASSYSTNKNEMLGKIILPLIKLIEEKTKEQIPLVCKGSLNDFYIKMWDINIKIWVIKRI